MPYVVKLYLNSVGPVRFGSAQFSIGFTSGFIQFLKSLCMVSGYQQSKGYLAEFFVHFLFFWDKQNFNWTSTKFPHPCLH